MQAKQHLQHLDVLKGIAIVMVVMGHALILSLGIRNPLVNAIASVHMPIFVFISGYLSGKTMEWSWTSLRRYWFRKVIQLLLPLSVLPLMYAMFYGHSLVELLYGSYHLGYWFTLALFLIFSVNFVFRGIEHVANQRQSAWVNVGLALAGIGFVYLIDLLLASNNELYDILSWKHVTWLYSYFVLGTLVRRHKVLENLMLNPWLSGVAGLCYVWLVYLDYTGHPLFRGIPMTLSGLILFYQIASSIVVRLPKAGGRLAYLGKNSLAIYLVHYFYIFSMSLIASQLDYITPRFGLELAVVLGFSAVVILLSLGTTALIRCNPLLALLLLGEQTKTKR